MTRWNLVYYKQLSIDNLLRLITFSHDDNYELQAQHEFPRSITKKDELMVQEMAKYLEGKVNPFESGRNDLINITTRKLIASENTTAITNLFETGCNIYKNFSEERIYAVKKISILVPLKNN